MERADLNGDNLRILGSICGSVITVGLGLGLGLGWVADCCIQTAGKSVKMRINHVIQNDQWRAAPRSAFCRAPSAAT